MNQCCQSSLYLLGTWMRALRTVDDSRFSIAHLGAPHEENS